VTAHHGDRKWVDFFHRLSQIRVCERMHSISAVVVKRSYPTFVWIRGVLSTFFVSNNKLAVYRAGRGERATTKGTKMDFDDLSNRVIGCAIEVHRHLGPGLLESAYEQCLAHELGRNGIAYQLQHPQPVQYKEIRLDCGYRMDMLVVDALILEVKSVDAIKGIHEAQLLTYMKLAGVKTGLLINFNITKLKDGIRRFVL
jgi:GxxExxY protein